MDKKQFRFFKIARGLFTTLVLWLLFSGCVTKKKFAETVSEPEVKTPIVIKEVEISKSAVSNAPSNPPIPQALILPKFALIFSAGGAKAWAHIGVLKELQKLKWPVSAVAGVEWGAVVAATFANNLSANEVEWEMSKLKDFDKWEQFIKAVYPKKMTADLKIPFVCPSLNIAKQNIYLLNRGQLDQLIPFCIASPGLIKPINQSVALMTDISAMAHHLRATGAVKIILINVLAQTNKRSFTKDYTESDNILWVESAALIEKKPAGIDEIVEIKLDDFGIKDLDKRRDIVAKGSELSYPQLKKLADKYGL